MILDKNALSGASSAILSDRGRGPYLRQCQLHLGYTLTKTALNLSAGVVY